MNDWSEKEKLHFAAQDGDLEEVKRLIQEGYNVNEFDEIGKTPLHYAAEKEHLEIIKFLIGKGADINAHDINQAGNTPLADIAGNCSFKIAKVLIENGADPTIRGWMQINALDRASKRKRGDGPKVYQLLLESSKNKKLKHNS